MINWLIIPYVALYLFYPVTLALAPRDDRGRMELALGVQGLFMATMFCVLFFLLLPAEIDLRDQLDTHWETNPPNWLEEALFTFIHVSDNPWNAWPSLHIVLPPFWPDSSRTGSRGTITRVASPSPSWYSFGSSGHCSVSASWLRSNTTCSISSQGW